MAEGVKMVVARADLMYLYLVLLGHKPTERREMQHRRIERMIAQYFHVVPYRRADGTAISPEEFLTKAGRPSQDGLDGADDQ